MNFWQFDPRSISGSASALLPYSALLSNNPLPGLLGVVVKLGSVWGSVTMLKEGDAETGSNRKSVEDGDGNHMNRY